MINERVKNSKNVFTLDRRFLRCNLVLNSTTEYILWKLNGQFHPQMLDIIDSILLYVSLWTQNQVSLNR